MSKTLKILIAYPQEFNCYSKFERKVKNILLNIKPSEILYLNDNRKFIDSFLSINMDGILMRKVLSPLEYINNITHAIIFDDGKSFNDDIYIIKNKKEIAIRVIKTPITYVINKKYCPDYDVYIGRGSGWGNPYAIGVDGDRDEVINKFKYDFDRGLLGEPNFKEKLLSLSGKRLACHCSPLPCHGDIYADYLNSYDDQK